MCRPLSLMISTLFYMGWLIFNSVSSISQSPSHQSWWRSRGLLVWWSGQWAVCCGWFCVYWQCGCVNVGKIRRKWKIRDTTPEVWCLFYTSVNLQLSLITPKSTKWPVHPAKTHISQGSCTVWSVPAGHSIGSKWPIASSSSDSKDWSDRVDAQADLESSLGAQVIWLVLSCFCSAKKFSVAALF